MTSIAPPGTDTSKWPKAMGAEQLAVRESAAKVKVANDNIEKNKQLINGITESYKAFFVAHFGIPPIDGIYKQYYENKVVKQGGGPGNALSIAQEIMEFTNPSASEYGLTKETMIGLTTAMCRFYDLYNIKQQAEAEAQEFLEAAIFKLEYRPSAEAVKAYNQSILAKFSSSIKNATSEKPFYGFKNDTQTKTHTGGYTIDGYEVLNYYQAAYERTPEYYWDFSSKHRLHAHHHPYYPGKVFVSVMGVDPGTGAYDGKTQYPIASSTNSADVSNPGPLLSKVKQNFFPDLFLLSDGITLTSKERKSAYKDQLTQASNMWTGIPDKAGTPIAITMEQKFQYKFTGTYLTGPDNSTTPAVNTLRVYMQPAGIEKALKRVLAIDNVHTNAVEKWFTTSFVPGVQDASDSKFKYRTGKMNKEDWKTYTQSLNTIMDTIYLVLNHPQLYSKGAYTVIESLKVMAKEDRNTTYRLKIDHTNITLNSTALDHAKLILQAADWPTAPPQLMFEAPFDDQRDVDVLVGMFNAHMNENHAVAPPMMYLPESFTGRLTSRAFIPSNDKPYLEFNLPQGVINDPIADLKQELEGMTAGFSQYDFNFSKGVTYRMNRGKAHYTLQTTNPDGGYTTVDVLYTRNTKTILTKTPIASQSITNLPQRIESKPYRGGGPSSPLADNDMAASVGISTLVTAGAVAATGPVGLLAFPVVLIGSRLL